MSAFTAPLFGDVYRNKKVLVTGNTGFKGSWLSVWLLMLGAKVYGLSNGVPTKPSHFEAAGLGGKVTYVEKNICCLHAISDVIKEIQSLCRSSLSLECRRVWYLLRYCCP